MSYTNPDLAILGCLARLAAIKTAMQAAVTSGTKLWTRVDASGDETYENRVKGLNLTDVDTAIATAQIGVWARTFFSDHVTYFSSIGLTGWGGYLDDRHLRLHQNAADVYKEAVGFPLDPKYVAASQTDANNVLGVYTFGVGVSGLATLASTFGPTPLYLETSVNFAGSNYSFDIVVDDTLNSNSVTFTSVAPSATTANSPKIIIGATSLSGAVSAGATTLSLNSRLGFKNGSYLIITNDTGTAYSQDPNSPILKEYVRVTEDVSGTSAGNITVSALKHSYQSGARVIPCFNKVTSISVNGTISAGSAKIVPLDDWTPSL